jgi:hypothetical protein
VGGGGKGGKGGGLHRGLVISGAVTG